MHERLGIVLCGGGDEGGIVERNECASGADAVGEGREVGEIGESGLEIGGVDGGLGVGVDGERAALFAGVFDDDRLSDGERALRAERDVVLIELREGNAVALRDG